MNLTYMLEEVFDLRDKRVGSLIHDRLPGSAAGRSFLSLLAGSSSVFESVSTAEEEQEEGGFASFQPSKAHSYALSTLQHALLEIISVTGALHSAPLVCSMLAATSIKDYGIYSSPRPGFQRCITLSSPLTTSVLGDASFAHAGEGSREFAGGVQVYCMAFEVLDREWLDMKASYMDFPAVMARVQAQLVRALSAQPGSLAELRRLLALTTNGAQ